MKLRDMTVNQILHKSTNIDKLLVVRDLLTAILASEDAKDLLFIEFDYLNDALIAVHKAIACEVCE